MYTTKLTPLERNVFGQNLINKLTIQNLEKVLPQLESFRNQKAMLADGSKAKKFVIDLLKVPHNSETGSSFRTYLHFHYGNLYLKQDVTVADKEYQDGGYGVTYYEREVRLGVVDYDGKLIQVFSSETCVQENDLRVIYDAKQVKTTLAKIDSLQDEIRELKRTVSLFINL